MALDFEIVTKVAKEYAVMVNDALPFEKAILFGPYVRGMATDFSAIDICFFVAGFGGHPLFELEQIVFRLARKFRKYNLAPQVLDVADIEKGTTFTKELLSYGVEL